MAVSPSGVVTRTPMWPLAMRWSDSPGSPSWNSTSRRPNRRRRARDTGSLRRSSSVEALEQRELHGEVSRVPPGLDRYRRDGDDGAGGDGRCRHEQAGRACDGTKAEQLHPYVSDLAGRALAAAPSCGWLDVDGTLAFFDISGFTTFDPERLAGLGRPGAEHINDILNLVFPAAHRRGFSISGGDVLEFGGDAMVVLFTGDDHERRAASPPRACSGRSARTGRRPRWARSRLGMSCGSPAAPRRTTSSVRAGGRSSSPAR